MTIDRSRAPRVLNRRHLGSGEDYPPDAVYVGRPSVWGNPFTIGPDGNRYEVIEKYRAYIQGRADLRLKIRTRLVGKNLICWCAPKACHADVLLELAEQIRLSKENP